jgi:hypothetical protein
MKLTEMARSGMLHESDIWRYSRIFKGDIAVRKELTVYQIICLG